MKVCVVSHAAVLPVNQEPFDALARAGATVMVLAPRTLRSDIRGLLTLAPLDGSAAMVSGLGVRIGGHARALGGQRGIHLILYRGLRAALAQRKPDVLFVEEEPFSLAAEQCRRAAARVGIPFVVHENQNIARRLPPPFEQIRRRVLRDAAGVTLRNASAEAVVRGYGFTGPVRAFPHAVDPTRYIARTDDGATIGFVGRLVEEKGIFDLIDAAGGMRLRVVGDGPARAAAEARAAAAGVEATWTGSLPHDAVPAEYARMTVVVIPSRTTPTWMEQFGRIVIEANAAGIPVIVSDSGELPATVAATGGGVVVKEGDVPALRTALVEMLADPTRAHALGAAGQATVRARFSPDAVAADLHAFLREVSA